MQYYDGRKLLSKKDLDGLTPQFYLCTTNRTGGKTTFFSRELVRDFLETGKKFILLYRFDYELDGVADRFFKDIRGLFFPSKCMEDSTVGKGVIKNLYIGNVADQEDPDKLDLDLMDPCGYAIAINKADAIKKYSHFLTDADTILFDEFQSETNNYCPNEITKFLSILTSVCRGNGKTFRYVRVIMLSNQVTLLNPYFNEMGIAERLTSQTKFLRGHGWVLENGFVEGAAEAIRQSPLARAFPQNRYVSYAAENIYLNESKSFIEPPPGEHGKYLCTIRSEGEEYGLIEYLNAGIVYVTTSVDRSCSQTLAATANDHDVNYVLLKNNFLFISSLRNFFEKGCFRFKNPKCKAAILKMLSY